MSTPTQKPTAVAEAKNWQQQKIRRRVWQQIRDDGPLALAGIVHRTGLDEKTVGMTCEVLRFSRYLSTIPHEDGHVRYCVTALPYNEQRIERELEKQNCREDPASPPPASGDDVAPMEPPAHRTSPTSQAAARSIAPHRRGQQDAIVEFLSNHGDGTREEIAQATGIAEKSVCPRITELRKAGVVRKTSRTRPSSSGRDVEVLELAPDRQRLF